MTNRTRSLIVAAAFAATVATGWHTAAHAQPQDPWDLWVQQSECALDVVPSGAPLEVTVDGRGPVTIEAPQTIHVDGPATVIVGHRTPKQYEERTYEVPACSDITTTTPPTTSTTQPTTSVAPPSSTTTIPSTTTTVPVVNTTSTVPTTTVGPPTTTSLPPSTTPPPTTVSVPPTTSTPTGDDSSTDELPRTGPSDLAIIATIGAIITAVGWGMTRIGKGDA